MNLLTDVPFHFLVQKFQAKKNTTKDKRCDIMQFSAQDVLDMLGNGNCAYTDTPFINLKDATFERVNPNLGYVKGNVVMVSNAANNHKAQLDCFVKHDVIPDAMKIKLLRKALYQLEKKK